MIRRLISLSESIERLEYDWTFFSSFEGDLNTKEFYLVRNEGSSLIDLNMLLKKDPFVLYESLSLFEDELADNGESKYTIKLVR